MQGLGTTTSKPWKTARDIKRSVCRRYKITIEEMDSDSAVYRISRPRQLAMALVRHKLGYSYPKIAHYFNRDPATVVFACKKHGIMPDPELSQRNRARAQVRVYRQLERSLGLAA